MAATKKTAKQVQISKTSLAAYRAHYTRLQNALADANGADRKAIQAKIDALTERARAAL